MGHAGPARYSCHREVPPADLSEFINDGIQDALIVSRHGYYPGAGPQSRSGVVQSSHLDATIGLLGASIRYIMR